MVMVVVEIKGLSYWMMERKRPDGVLNVLKDIRKRTHKSSLEVKMEEDKKEIDCCENCYVCGGCEHSLMDEV